MTDPADLTATQLARLYRSGELSPVEAALACLERISRFNPQVNAFCCLDEEKTLAMARRSERRYVSLSPLGPLDGIPVGMKDMLSPNPLESEGYVVFCFSVP